MIRGTAVELYFRDAWKLPPLWVLLRIQELLNVEAFQKAFKSRNLTCKMIWIESRIMRSCPRSQEGMISRGLELKQHNSTLLTVQFRRTPSNARYQLWLENHPSPLIVWGGRVSFWTGKFSPLLFLSQNAGWNVQPNLEFQMRPYRINSNEGRVGFRSRHSGHYLKMIFHLQAFEIAELDFKETFLRSNLLGWL